MVSLDLSLSKDFFNTSLKLFDGELSFREIKKSGLNKILLKHLKK